MTERFSRSQIFQDYQRAFTEATSGDHIRGGPAKARDRSEPAAGRGGPRKQRRPRKSIGYRPERPGT